LLVSCGCVYAQDVTYISPKQIEVRASSKLQMNTDPHNILDQDHGTRWASNDIDNPQWIEICFPQEIELSGLIIDWFNKNTRAAAVQISVSNDGENWVTVEELQREILASGYTEQLVFAKHAGKYVRVDLADPVGLAYSISDIQIPGIRFDDPFILHVGIGSGNGEAYLPSEGERLKLDVLIPIYTNTFTRKWELQQEYYVAKEIVNYRDWLDQVIGHNLYESYHLIISDELLKRNDIQEVEPNSFWLSPGNVWENLTKFQINPSNYDLVWSLWSWENRSNAQQQYGGAALTGPNGTPFMSFSVSAFGAGSEGILMVMAHEAQHTYEDLFAQTGNKVVTNPPIDGFPHADRQPQLLEAILELEPDLFEPWKSYDEAILHRAGGPLQYPGKTMQLTVDAWAHRQQPRERYLQIATRYGELIPGREDLVIQPLFESITVISDKEERQVYLPVQVRNRGLHVAGLTVTAKIGDQTIVLTEDSYTRHPNIRMPKQIRWSTGWEGNGFYGSWLPLTKADKEIELTVAGEGINEVFIIPIKYIVVQDMEIAIQSGSESAYLYSQANVEFIDGIGKFGVGSSLQYQIPMTIFKDGLVGYYLELTGNGYISLKANMPGVFSTEIWSGELRGETVKISIPKGLEKMFKDEEYLYLELVMPKLLPAKYKANPMFELQKFSINCKSFY